MPLPEPTAGEDRGDFIERCIVDTNAKKDFPEDSQRFVFCATRWDNMGTAKSVVVDADITKSDMPRTLIITRSVVNADDVIAWAKSQGFKSTLSAEDLHVTIAFSKRPMDWFDVPDTLRSVRIPAGGARFVHELGTDGAIVLRFKSDALQARHMQLLEQGASWDFPSFKPHMTITTDLGDLDLDDVEPFQGEIILGVEKFAEIKEGFSDGLTEKLGPVFNVEKIDHEKRLAFGWFSVIEQNGKPVVDLHGDVILEDTLLEAAHNHMLDSRAGKAMHTGRRIADVVESLVFTKDLQKALGIDLHKVGWFGAVKIRDEKVWKRVKSGELSAFSIGGIAIRTPI